VQVGLGAETFGHSFTSSLVLMYTVALEELLREQHTFVSVLFRNRCRRKEYLTVYLGILRSEFALKLRNIAFENNWQPSTIVVLPWIMVSSSRAMIL
jgi:hypothetical protein